MKNRLLKRGTISLAFVALVSLLGACATATSPLVENKSTQEQRGAGPLVTQGYAGNGNNFTVREVHAWPPIGE
jgi:hypothetical protein